VEQAISIMHEATFLSATSNRVSWNTIF